MGKDLEETGKDLEEMGKDEPVSFFVFRVLGVKQCFHFKPFRADTVYRR